jgi:hypothetical protein
MISFFCASWVIEYPVYPIQLIYESSILGCVSWVAQVSWNRAITNILEYLQRYGVESPKKNSKKNSEKTKTRKIKVPRNVYYEKNISKKILN